MTRVFDSVKKGVRLNDKERRVEIGFDNQKKRFAEEKVVTIYETEY